MRGSISWLLLLLIWVSAVPVSSAERKVIAPEGVVTGFPFSPGILSGDFLY